MEEEGVREEKWGEVECRKGSLKYACHHGWLIAFCESFSWCACAWQASNWAPLPIISAHSVCVCVYLHCLLHPQLKHWTHTHTLTKNIVSLIIWVRLFSSCSTVISLRDKKRSSSKANRWSAHSENVTITLNYQYHLSAHTTKRHSDIFCTQAIAAYSHNLRQECWILHVGTLSCGSGNMHNQTRQSRKDMQPLIMN